MENIFSYDAETNGLWGQAFAIAAVCSNGNTFIGRCPIEGPVNDWVESNVLPQMENIQITHNSYKELLSDFVSFWRANEGTALVHMGQPVEARLWIDAHNMGIIGDWDAPYLQIDLASFKEVEDSVDAYNKKYNISVDPATFNGGTHNPLFDAQQALNCYQHLTR